MQRIVDQGHRDFIRLSWALVKDAVRARSSGSERHGQAHNLPAETEYTTRPSRSRGSKSSGGIRRREASAGPQQAVQQVFQLARGERSRQDRQTLRHIADDRTPTLRPCKAKEIVLLLTCQVEHWIVPGQRNELQLDDPSICQLLSHDHRTARPSSQALGFRSHPYIEDLKSRHPKRGRGGRGCRRRCLRDGAGQ